MAQVLLIDDDPIQLKVRAKILGAAGVDVRLADSAEAALSMLQASPGDFALIMTDHMLPGASGAEFVRQLRAFNSTVPVIVVSGLAEAEGEYTGLDVSFCPKPCPPLALIALVRSLTGQAA